MLGMQIIVLSPNVSTLFSDKLIKKINQAGDVVWVKKITPLAKVKELFSEKEKIVAIDPDFCDWKVAKEIIEKIPNLKAICLQTTSFSWIDVDFCKAKKIPVVNLRGFSSVAVAEWVTLMVLALARRAPLFIKEGFGIDYVKYQGTELRGKTAGIIGLGTIGRIVAENMKGLGMNVVYWSKSTTSNKYKKVTLPYLMRTADVIVPALAINDQTRGLLNDKLIKSMKSTAILASPLDLDEIYNHQLVLKMVANGKIWGYGFESKKPIFEKLKGNVWAGPEMAWCTNDSFRKNGEQWTENILNAVENKHVNRVN